jgi:adenine-specific DNA-methyltransferase
MQSVQVAAMKASFSKPQHEPQLMREDRRARGVFYTPVEIANWIVAQTYGPSLREWNGAEPPPKLLDPACGAGVFLQAAIAALQDRCLQLQLSKTEQELAITQAIFGIDIDVSTVMKARQQTKLPASNLKCADALTESDLGSFDVVVGNPPYVSIREMARSHTPEYVNGLRERFQTARGNFDLYVLFIERALQLLKPGGRLGLIVPNKWATLDYARKLREMLLRETSLEQIVDLSTLRVFPQAGTYPQIIVLQRQPAATDHCLRISHVTDFAGFQRPNSENQSRWIPQASLQPRAFVLGNEIRVEDRVKTLPLESIATLHSGASGYSANLLAAELQEATAASDEAVDFIVSGSIDRYAIHLGDVRFLKQTWQRPCLSLRSPAITAAKARLYREPKIVLSGMCRRLEVAYDEQRCALGVQVYAAAEMKVDPFYLLGVLNSKLLSYLFRERFGAKCLAGGYLSVNKGQLAQLPIAADDRQSGSLQQRIADLAQRIHVVNASVPVEMLDEQIDALVYELYTITAAERQLIEESFATTLKKAAKKRAA